MEPNAFPQLQLWCPRPFGTFSQNKPCATSTASTATAPAPPRKPPSCCPTENTPPEPPEPGPAAPAATEDGRVLLDTWYVIKPGNTKEKVAFFVAHQCGAGGRASTMKVKGNWGSDSSKAKRRRRCHDPKTAPGWAAGAGDAAKGAAKDAEGAGNAPDLLSVAEMVALVERRAALALHGLPRPGEAPAPLVLLEAPGGPECRRVAAAVAQFESQQRREHGAARPNGLCRAGGTGAGGADECGAAAAPGEVRIAFRISSGCEPRGGTTAATTAPERPRLPGAKDQITCDLYRLVSPARAGVELLLAAKGDKDGTDEAAAAAASTEPGGGSAESAASAASARDCASGFHVDVVVTGVVDQCVFFGKDSAKQVTEETVRLPDEPPPPGQLFLLPGRPEEPAGGAAAPGRAAAGDPALCRLYRHVSHDFLEIRFKIQRLLEPRQYMLLLPEHVMVKIFSYLPTQALAALKCSCHYFKQIIETFGVQATDSRWNRDPLYRDDPCKQCKKRYERGDVSLCRWHPKPYHHDLPYGRSYWMCCRRPDREAPGCRTGLHDNNWVHPAGRREDGR
ncbi:F-box only protein 46 [Lonchura striata]|uniref:F-box only protein 46 n=1 Tax=Lonchura striata TaxID=40157 RepID=A0A218UBD1_9PASE|nr:F-box only protein 46 [Lonchura striata domestica]OWK51029.1 F-box only protein 46 [Lonchura striata domestica]